MQIHKAVKLTSSKGSEKEGLPPSCTNKCRWYYKNNVRFIIKILRNTIFLDKMIVFQLKDIKIRMKFRCNMSYTEENPKSAYGRKFHFSQNYFLVYKKFSKEIRILQSNTSTRNNLSSRKKIYGLLRLSDLVLSISGGP